MASRADLELAKKLLGAVRPRRGADPRGPGDPGRPAPEGEGRRPRTHRGREGVPPEGGARGLRGEGPDRVPALRVVPPAPPARGGRVERRVRGDLPRQRGDGRGQGLLADPVAAPRAPRPLLRGGPAPHLPRARERRGGVRGRLLEGLPLLQHGPHRGADRPRDDRPRGRDRERDRALHHDPDGEGPRLPAPERPAPPRHQARQRHDRRDRPRAADRPRARAADRPDRRRDAATPGRARTP